MNTGLKKQHTHLCPWRLPLKLCGQSISIILLLSILSGCSAVSIVGLRPVYPPVEKKTFEVFSDFVEVDSLQPTFQWQPFQRSEDDIVDNIQDITYELRIWTTIPGPSGKLTYARYGLEQPSHKLEESLEPAIQYYWSVRACFMIDGYLRVTEWGMAGIPLRNESVPNRSCFRFKTPGYLPEKY